MTDIEELAQIHQSMLRCLERLTADERAAIQELVERSARMFTRSHQQLQQSIEQVLGIDAPIALASSFLVLTSACMRTSAVAGHTLGYEREEWLQHCAEEFDAVRIVSIQLDAPLGKPASA